MKKTNPQTPEKEKVIIVRKPPQNQDADQSKSDSTAVASAQASVSAPKSVPKQAVVGEEEQAKEVK